MVRAEDEMQAACGLDCAPCSIRRLPFAVRWFRPMSWLKEGEDAAEAVERGMYCNGCGGDRSVHWSADCEILLCCVDERGLAHCGQCAELMGCGKLEAFAADGRSHHKEAVMRLRGRFGSTGGSG